MSNQTSRAEDDSIASSKLALFIAFNAMIVHEALATLGRAGVNPLSSRPRTHTMKDWLIGQWRSIQVNINYEPVFDLATRVLEQVPSHGTIESVLSQLGGVASRIVASKALLKHDVAGRIYHTLLLRDVAKGLATYYTSIPGAYLLAKLSIETPGLEGSWRGLIESPPIIADLACGSGTLLSASYSTVRDSWTRSRLDCGLDISEEDLRAFHRIMLERVIYGFDVLDYAVHLAAAWLTLRMADIEIGGINTYKLPLGQEPGKTWLGSLSMDVDSSPDTCKLPIATALTGKQAGAESVDLRQRERRPVSMPRPKLIIMNPPFARTGNVGHSILLGHLAEPEKTAVLRELRTYFGRISEDLGGAVGKAGLAAPFVWLANKAISTDGRLAFVLPRVALSGVSWEPIRGMLTKNYRIDHIVVSYDPAHNWAWSENTVLSEILLVCTRAPHGDSSVKATYVYRRPRSALEAKILGSGILEANAEEVEHGFTQQADITLGSTKVATVYEVSQKLLTNERNWNVCMGFASPQLCRAAWDIHRQHRFLSYEIPLTTLEDCVERVRLITRRQVTYEPNIGYDVATYQRCKDPHEGILLDVLEGANVSTLNSIEVSPNARVRFSSDCGQLSTRTSNFLIAGVGRFWVYTIGLISVFCRRPVISNTMWTAKLRPLAQIGVEDAARLQALWLNSTPGLLNALALRQDSKGAFIQMKKEYLPQLKVLDLKRLTKSQIRMLLELYEKLRGVNVPSIPNQLVEASGGRGFRHILDSTLLTAIEPRFDVELFGAIYDRLLQETIIREPM